MKKTLSLVAITAALLISGCAEKQIAVNGVICPAGTPEDRIKADFQECRYYDLKAAGEASKAPITVECKTCLEKKGYKIEQ
ncbi:MAG: hypothetical protein PHI47_14360 [Sulfuricurvum sp.]|uniref:hypothetical protein n=1 Tax=Sulfuricurvum sp. TaxID=2025608 RepID=UPI002606E889|nr:hypothetical protein [Sulfuricurvum sp.]MDD5161229.1 hypothetical protein [Sulfuricurvum sp.]